MKRYIALLLVLVMLLAACGTGSTETTIDNTTDTGTAEATGDSSGTDTTTTTTTTENTDDTQVPTEETSKPTDGTAVSEDYTLKISQSTLSLEAGQIGNLTVNYTGTGTIVWSSNKESVATVSNGKVTAKAAGTAVITVTDGVKSSQCVVTVTKKTETPVEVTLKLSKSSMSLKVGETATLSVTYTGSKSLTWTSSNTAYATVSNGKITAKAAGTAYITVTDGVKSATCTVTVTNAAAPVVVNLSVSPTTLNLVVGNTSTLTTAYNGTGTLSWSSNNTSVATVSNGKVTAKAAGEAVITVSDGTRNAQCRVFVTAPAALTLTINTKNNTTISAGATLQIDYTYSGDKSKLTWSSTDTSVLTVNGSGLVTAIAAGSATVKVTDGTTTKRVSIVIEASAAKATSLKESSHNAPLYDGVVKYAGDYMSFEVSVKPDESNPNVVVTSTNTSIVSASCKLNSHGINVITLNFKSAGSATVTITSADGAVSKSYSITVKSGYNSPHGYGQLTPQQWADCCNAVVAAHDFTITSCGSYKWLTLSDAELTWANAVWHGEQFVRAWWPDGSRRVNITYMGLDEDGNHLFYTYH